MAWFETYADGIQQVAGDNAECGMRNAELYNLNGQKVSANYKGIVIQNGKKVLVK